MLDWRDKTRQAFPAGFEVLIEVWENPSAGIPPSLVSRRVAFLRGLLENLGVARRDIGPEDVYQSREKILVMEHERFLNTASLILQPRCPHLCCDQGNLR
ncbi:hypothetical protein [Cupriavidus malaysiensis]|uniref:Uncharacterized protein n=1 Tax=Cupriavidus malaysiensis TaxID=367825 RepID=A0ABM6F0C1_9BURK|nr:hypothetical protein [Cupriavidus malaysiensis]AOZ04698.1 hypothetical protein BKK80_01725 [Cupriavidus malaysiensis]